MLQPTQAKCCHCRNGYVPGRGNRGFCSLKCASAFKVQANRGDRTACVDCGGPMGEYGAMYCSNRCKSRAHMRRNGWSPAAPKPKKLPPPPASSIYPMACTVCSRAFIARSGRAKYCSDRCRLDNISCRVMGLYREAIKVRNFGAAHKWHRDLCEYLVLRDGPDCGICGGSVDLTLRSGVKGDDAGPSVDHVVPRSKGGSDDLSNLRLAHWGCNRKRGNRGEVEQLCLVG